MTSAMTVPFGELSSADLVVGATYAGGTAGTVGDDPINKLLPVGNQGGIRYAGSVRDRSVKAVVLYMSHAVLEWPDAIDMSNSVATYFGDNRTAGHELHGTPRSGNALLRDIFQRAHESAESRRLVPPVFFFEKIGKGRSVRFRGLAAPGYAGLSLDDDLVAIWRRHGGEWFQNYKARFTVLDAKSISREWLDKVCAGSAILSDCCPDAWRVWVEERRYLPLGS